jgi:periplasmic divalent cation tolerance protein
MTNKILVLTTTGSEDEAMEIAHALVEKHLAACVNVLPRISSVYCWQGEVEEAEEYLLVIKTSSEIFAQVRDAIKTLHSYEVPECIAVAIVDGSEPYLNWIAESLRP